MRRLVTIIALLACAGHARACLYDDEVGYDLTHGLPSISSILAGKWERHSDAYYDSLIRTQTNRVSRVQTDGRTLVVLNINALVSAYIHRGAYESVPPLLNTSGNTFVESAAIYSSRATVHLALGNFDAARADLTKALELTSTGCFRREAYELQLAEYLQALQADPSLGKSQPTFLRAMLCELPTHAQPEQPLTDEQCFATPRVDARIDEAVTAVSAMIRFGNPQSTQLYAALGDLLRARGDYALAYRAFRRALDSGHPYPEVIAAQLDAVGHQVADKSLIADSAIDAERREAERWVEAFRAREGELLKAGEDAGNRRNYATFYKAHGDLRSVETNLATILATQSARFWKPLVLLAGIVIVFVLMLARWIRERRSAPASA